MSTSEETAAESERQQEVDQPASPKPLSDLPGEGMGSFAEDDPELHEASRNVPDDE